MSITTSLAKPLAKAILQCPYCDHVSPVGSKFCVECGAALHLIPCPHCGTVNDITAATACYRCHGELRKNDPAVQPLAIASTAVATGSPLAEASAYVSVQPTRQKPHVLVVAVVLLAFAAASYYAYRQRSTLDAREPQVATTDVKGPAPPGDISSATTANVGVGTITKVPSDALQNPVAKPVMTNTLIATPVDTIAAKPEREPPGEVITAARASGGKSSFAREAIESPAPTASNPSDFARARTDASKGLEKQTPNIGPCTEAVAALGLCTPETTPRRQ